MTKHEFNQAIALAKDIDVILSGDIDQFLGFGLPDFTPICVTVQQVARLIRWQAGRFDGTWDTEAITEVWVYGRGRFNIIP
jgi:hypothetical protein